MEESSWLAEIVMEAKDKVVQYRKSTFAGDDRLGNDRGNGGYGERLARLEVHVQHLKENSATKEDIATVNGRLDTVAEALKNLVTKDDLLANRRWLTGTIIAMGTLLFVALAAFVAILGYVNPSLPPSVGPSEFPAPRSEQVVPPPPTPPATPHSGEP